MIIEGDFFGPLRAQYAFPCAVCGQERPAGSAAFGIRPPGCRNSGGWLHVCNMPCSFEARGLNPFEEQHHQQHQQQQPPPSSQEHQEEQPPPPLPPPQEHQEEQEQQQQPEAPSQRHVREAAEGYAQFMTYAGERDVVHALGKELTDGLPRPQSDGTFTVKTGATTSKTITTAEARRLLRKLLPHYPRCAFRGALLFSI
jgi:hypothetical protein